MGIFSSWSHACMHHHAMCRACMHVKPFSPQLASVSCCSSDAASFSPSTAACISRVSSSTLSSPV